MFNKNSSSLSKLDSEVTQKEDQTGRIESGYDHFKHSGFQKISSSVMLPINDGSIKLTMEKGNTPAANLPLCDDPSMTQTLKNRGLRKMGTVNHANVTAVIRRRQQRRYINGLRGRDFKCLRFILNIFYYVGLSPYRPQTSRMPPNVLGTALKVSI